MSAVLKRRAIQPDDEWMGTDEAAVALGVSRKSYTDLAYVPHISASVNGHSGRGVGCLYRRDLVARIAKIRIECRVGFRAAVRIEAAQREQRI